MNTIYLILVIVLFILAISDLIVGVSNDAVNFLNSAIGSKVASFKVIMSIAALGVLVGATFSSGMMEVARKGINNPEMFYFNEIMIIFLAVMITDVILLDVFNTMGLPTSTTVSIVFELLGASVAVAVLKSYNDPNLGWHEFINAKRALEIIAGILLSVFVAFTIGAFVQYATRLIFSFNYKNSLKYFGSLWGGFAITAITYFILIKGAKGSSFVSGDQHKWIMENAMLIVGISFVIWSALLQGISYFVKFNVLKFTVIIGTFALAMAFAGNDLVNFIGVPLAGYSAFQEFISQPNTQPDELLMVVLQTKTATPTLILLIAGLIMVLTLWFSKKAKTVVETSLDLSRQDEGEERFESFPFARAVVRAAMKANSAITKVIPDTVLDKMSSRFQAPAEKQDDGVSFDLLRASVNLVVASIIISFATSLKLPLSTTYVTFMVTMGTSFADKAWGRESAVYRISGVLTVIAGWFFTAFTAFTAAFIFATIIYYGGMIAVACLIIIAILFVIRTHTIHKKREAEKEVLKKDLQEDEQLSHRDNLLRMCNRSVLVTLSSISRVYYDIIQGTSNEDRSTMRNVGREVETLCKQAKSSKSNLNITVARLEEQDVETGLNYVQIIDYNREITRSIRLIYEQTWKHLDNNHKSFSEDQKTELLEMAQKISDYTFDIAEIIKTRNYDQMERVTAKNEALISEIEGLRKIQVKRIKKEQDNTKRSLLYLSVLFESRNIINDSLHMLKTQERFMNYDQE